MKRKKKKAILPLFLCLITVCLMFQYLFAPCIFADVIVDNGGPGTSSTGSWLVSGGTNPYGTDSLWSRDESTYTWEIGSQPNGYYEVFMWWSGWSSRASIVPVDIRHADGEDSLFINQRQNAGIWNSLGTYYFDGSGSVTITAAYGSSVSTCADAVWFRYVSDGEQPLAHIDSISPNPAAPDENITFSGHGEIVGRPVESCVWESDIDGILSREFTFSSSSLSPGNHIISFYVFDDHGVSSEPATEELVVENTSQEIIIDNGNAGTSSTGSWYVSGAPGAYGSDSFWSRDGSTYTWSFSPQVSSTYTVSMWWAQASSRSSNVPVRIQYYSGGLTSTTVAVNQKANGGKWNVLGTYYYQAGRTYRITVTSRPAPATTCADAVRFVQAQNPENRPPSAEFSADRTSGSVPCTVQFYDRSTGSVTSRLWDFGDGSTSTQKDPVHQYAQAGTFKVTLRASNAYGSDTEVKDGYIQVYAAAENIYLCDGFSKSSVFLPRCYDYLGRIGAVERNGVWVYTNTAKGITYNIYSVRTTAAMEQALKEEGSHIIFNGHSNFGFGAAFADSKEAQNKRIDNIYFVDDDRFTHYSPQMVSCNTDSMRYGQAYPNWNPVYKNGKSAIMPYTFSQGTPPYNYHPTYTIPGDPTTYRIELSDGSYLERFPDSNTPAWFSQNGSLPDPATDPDYFITNTDPDFNRCDFTGTWTIAKTSDDSGGYRGYNYQYRNAGTGANKATYSIYLRKAGNYEVSASWHTSTANATNATYLIRHAGGTAEVTANQQETLPNGSKLLGTYSFNQGTAKVELSDNANGRVIADMITFTCKDNPATILQAEFDASVRSGTGPLAVKFTDRSTAYGNNIKSRLWNFGDGTTSTETNPVHAYDAPGVYTVSLQVTDTADLQSSEEKESLITVSRTAPTHAEFTAPKRWNSGRTVVDFKDMSSGPITSWRWEFGDGTISSEQNPTHVYKGYGSFTVRLTVSGSGGSDSETETDYVNNLVADEYVDNLYHEKPHYYTGSSFMSGKIICDTGSVKIPSEEMRYSRMFYGACSSSDYAGVFNRGVFFFTREDMREVAAPEYLRRYLLGETDKQILARLNAIEPIYEYYNFTLKPPSMR